MGDTGATAWLGSGSSTWSVREGARSTGTTATRAATETRIAAAIRPPAATETAAGAGNCPMGTVTTARPIRHRGAGRQGGRRTGSPARSRAGVAQRSLVGAHRKGGSQGRIVLWKSARTAVCCHQARRGSTQRWSGM
uniref:CDKG1 n=1 Tax=Arundo donax TaxID=35708 RepID=A0A0A9J0K6_ARUDO